MGAGVGSAAFAMGTADGVSVVVEGTDWEVGIWTLGVLAEISDEPFVGGRAEIPFVIRESSEPSADLRVSFIRMFKLVEADFGRLLGP